METFPETKHQANTRVKPRSEVYDVNQMLLYNHTSMVYYPVRECTEYSRKDDK